MEDDFSMSGWFAGENEKISKSENRIRLQMFVNFIYSCLKSDILQLDCKLEEIKRVIGFNNLEEWMNNLVQGDLNKDNFETYVNIWMVILSYGTKKLEKIAAKCHLSAYDDFNLSHPNCQQFREEIEKAFSESGFPLDWENPIFKVADNVFEK